MTELAADISCEELVMLFVPGIVLIPKLMQRWSWFIKRRALIASGERIAEKVRK